MVKVVFHHKEGINLDTIKKDLEEVFGSYVKVNVSGEVMEIKTEDIGNRELRSYLRKFIGRQASGKLVRVISEGKNVFNVYIKEKQVIMK